MSKIYQVLSLSSGQYLGFFSSEYKIYTWWLNQYSNGCVLGEQLLDNNDNVLAVIIERELDPVC